MNLSISNYFQTPFLSDFTLTSSILPFTDQELTKIDHELSEYERIYLDPDIEKHLYRRNELMASFAISKAENSELTLVEAQKVYDLILRGLIFFISIYLVLRLTNQVCGGITTR